MKNLQVQDGGLLAAGPRPVVVGIDQSYSGFGLTVLTTTGPALHFSWLYKGQGSGVERLVDIQSWLGSVIAKISNDGHEVKAVAHEGYAPGAKFGREIAGELGAVVKMTLHFTLPFTPVYSVPPTRLKKYVTGKGTAVAKNQMLLQVYKKWGVEFHDDNLADSYGLAHLVSGRASTAYEREVYSAVVSGAA